jgi:hypothetical protein
VGLLERGALLARKILKYHGFGGYHNKKEIDEYSEITISFQRSVVYLFLYCNSILVNVSPF